MKRPGKKTAEELAIEDVGADDNLWFAVSELAQKYTETLHIRAEGESVIEEAVNDIASRFVDGIISAVGKLAIEAYKTRAKNGGVDSRHGDSAGSEVGR